MRAKKYFRLATFRFRFFGKAAIKIIKYEKVGKTLDEWGNGKF